VGRWVGGNDDHWLLVRWCQTITALLLSLHLHIAPADFLDRTTVKLFGVVDLE
jgi:hypothetical protein